MREDIYFANEEPLSLNLYYCGMEQCIPEHTYGPAMRDHYVFVYIKKGKGICKINNIVYNLSSGYSFFLFPHQLCYYKADPEDPWEYVWVGFNGMNIDNHLKQVNVTMDYPIYRHEDVVSIQRLLDMLIKKARIRYDFADIQCAGYLYQIMSEIIQNTNSEIGKKTSLNEEKHNNWYIQKALKHISANYRDKITCSTIANHVGLERSYFSKLFKQFTGQTLHDFLMKYRIEKACNLLNQTDETVEHIASAVGFEYLTYFSNTFKKYIGLTPSEYRKNYHLKAKAG